MMATNAKSARMTKEIKMLTTTPPPGVFCSLKGDALDQLEAQVIGGEGTPYERGVFKLNIHVTDRYPFEPPTVTFETPIYHPNIDDAGRICLDILKMPPKGAWRPSINISTILTSIQLLMSEPNPDDPLMSNIATEFKYNRPTFDLNARKHTTLHATQVSPGATDKKSTQTGIKGNVRI